MFHVICLEDGQPYTRGGIVQVFSTGDIAARCALRISAETGKRHQPRPVKSDDWKARERGRFERGEYLRLPWAEFSWWQGSIGDVEHFAHVSTTKDGMVAFTEDAAKGAADRQTRIKPGVYLTRFYPSLGQEHIQALALDFAGKYEEHELRFARTPDEIEHVYTNGPNSCMSGKGSDYDGGIHPCRVYGAGDLAVAYLTDGDEITARALCWPEKLAYSRIYGDEHRLSAALQQAGYSWRPSHLRGARMLRITDGGYFVCPYIDGCPGVEDDGKYLRIGGNLASDSTNGLIDMACGEHCPHCGEHRDDEFTYIRDVEEAWCSNCTDNDAYYVAHNDAYYADRDNVVEMANGDYWTVEYFGQNGDTCEATGENHEAEALVHVSDVGETWSRDYHRDNGFICAECSEAFSNAARGALRDCCETCTGKAQPRDARGRYQPRQGRDEHPSQLEISDHVPF